MSSDDDQLDWFSADESSNSDDDAHRLEAVPDRTQPGDDWFGESEPSQTTDTSVPKSSAPGNQGRVKLLFAGVVVAVLGTIGGAAWLASSLLSDPDATASPSLKVPPTPIAEQPEGSSTVADSECASSESATAVSGNGEGDQKSTAGVVLAFQHAYYVDRDADKMKPLLAKDSQITDLAALQRGIDSVDRGTTHCLRVVEDGEKAALVDLTQTAPDGSETTYKQRVTTTREDDAVKIVSIEDRSEGDRE